MGYNYFLGCVSEGAVRLKYKELAKKLHPDVGGKQEDFVSMKEEYDSIIYDTPSYPISNGTFGSGIANFVTMANNHVKKYPVSTEEALSPEELNNRKAKFFFDGARAGDNRYDKIDKILNAAKAEGLKMLWVSQQLGKIEELELTHFKYLTWMTKENIGVAYTLFHKYKTAKSPIKR